jgi:two-component system response regulator YesN
VHYIEENYAQPLSMQSVCDEIGISQTYLSRLFRKYSETTFNAFLTRCRMEAAMKLLRDKPDLLLRDVAACVGYDDSSYFTKVFHQYTGKTPSQFTE